MNSYRGLFTRGMLLRLAVFLVLLTVAVCAGLYFGKRSVPWEPVFEASQASRTPVSNAGQNGGNPENAGASSEQDDEAPLFLHIGGTGQENREVAQAQIELASSAGVNRFIVPVALDWSAPADTGVQSEGCNALLEMYIKANDKARLILWVDLNPSVSWLEQHAEAAIVVNEALQAYPSISSALWLDTARQLLEKLIREVESGPYSSHLLGYGLAALKDQCWMLGKEFDESEANTAGFRKWLERIYNTVEALRGAWGNPDVGFDTAAIPERPETEDTCNALVALPGQQSLVDFYRYCTEQVAAVLAGFASLTAEASTLEPLILAPYGYSFEALHSASGHFGVELLFDSKITGFVSPVSYFDRGLGGVGGMMGAIDSLTVRGKTLYLIEDTRTGVERDAETGEFARVKGIRAGDVYEVQRRNFSMALTYGLGLVWSDPQGEGRFHDQEQWSQFKALRDIYVKHMRESGDNGGPEGGASITVVVDEASKYYLQCAEHMNIGLLQRGRDAVLRTGVSARFHLLRGVIDGVAPPTPIYLFLNAFQLSADDRARLHARFAMEQACAIWVYAPGYFGMTPDVENISATTGMKVRAFEGPTQSGSRFILSGQHLQNEQDFGTQEQWAPLFYIEKTDDVDFLARYEADEKKGSVAMVTLPEQWTSLYIAEPELSPALLSELVRILEVPLFPNTSEGIYYDAVFARGPLLAVHASQEGKRSISLNRFCNIEDQLDPRIGWFQKESILIPMRTGETRLLLQRELPVDVH